LKPADFFRRSCFRFKQPPGAKVFEQELRSNTLLPSADIHDRSLSGRQELVAHAAENVPFYKSRYAGFDFSGHGKEWFVSLPILEKIHIRQHKQDLISKTVDVQRLRPSTTGGTTGEPLMIYADPKVPLSMMTWRMLNEWGVDVSDNSAYLYRAIPRGIRKHIIDIALFPTRRAYIAAAEMGRPEMECFTKTLLKIKPKYLVGYVGAIDAYADYLNEVGVRIPSLKVIWTTAAPLPELKRKYFQETFGCPAYTQYGCVETFMIAAECKCQFGLHIYNDIRYVEIVDENGQPVPDGEWGDILVTDLTNYAFPLIRYRLGDRGRMLTHRCECGSPFPLMDYVKGRISDQIYLKDGTSVPGEYWTTIFDDFPDAIKSFQVYQYGDFRIEIRFEPKSVNHTAAIEAVKMDLGAKLKDRAEFSFKQCEINNNENGKTRFVKSELAH
jgi:phenylacetate-CoA ligase